MNTEEEARKWFSSIAIPAIKQRLAKDGYTISEIKGDDERTTPSLLITAPKTAEAKHDFALAVIATWVSSTVLSLFVRRGSEFQTYLESLPARLHEWSPHDDIDWQGNSQTSRTPIGNCFL